MTGVRVGVEATTLTNRRGYGRFARNAVARLVEADPSTTYVLYVDGQSAEEIDVPAGAELVPVALAQAPARAASADSSRSLPDLLRLTRAVRRGGLDAFLFPSVYLYFPVLGTPTVVGVHDAIADELPELTLPSRRARAFWRLKERLALRLATRVFTVSEASRAVVAERFGLHREAIAVVPEAPAAVFTPRREDQVADALASVELEPGARYLLFVGGISPHKNLETLLDAYAALARERVELPPLVVVGELSEDPYMSAANAVRERMAELGLGSRVRLPGYVSDETLARLYSGATAVVIPSLAEGFGLPAVEAAACGAPLVLSDLPAHRETLGDAAAYFAPTDRAALAAALGRVLDEPGVRRSLAERGGRAVERLSWDATAERLRSLIHQVARS